MNPSFATLIPARIRSLDEVASSTSLGVLTVFRAAVGPRTRLRVPRPREAGFFLTAALAGPIHLEAGSDSREIAHQQLDFRAAATDLMLTFVQRGIVLCIWIPACLLEGAAAEPPCLELSRDSSAAHLLFECVRQADQVLRGGRPVEEPFGEILQTLFVRALREAGAGPARPRKKAPRYVQLAEEWMHRLAAESVDAAAMARELGVSSRTLHDGFRKHRGESPMRYLRNLRLAKVREDLLNPGRTETVTEIALRHGFNHLGRFSAYYFERFGERPSDTARRS